MFYLLVTVLLCCIMSYIRAYTDFILIEQYGKSLEGDYKRCTSFMTFIFSGLLAVPNIWYYKSHMFTLIIPVFMLLHGFVFDSSINTLRGEKLNYLGKGPIDMFWSKVPGQWFVRLTLILILLLWFIRLSHSY